MEQREIEIFLTLADVRPAYQQIQDAIARAVEEAGAVRGTPRVGSVGAAAGQFVLEVAEAITTIRSAPRTATSRADPVRDQHANHTHPVAAQAVMVSAGTAMGRAGCWCTSVVMEVSVAVDEPVT